MGVMTPSDAPPPPAPRSPLERFLVGLGKGLLVLLVLVGIGWGLLYATCGGCR